ncbi:hypothetical protein [Nannocystis punicea]|uniref:Uncharacterized protein n=1 Tax=Nannocystis punicea TaxID=2995304 RepID=A0ABY7HBR8_9BACT|nr:hypothetical protein [Nannocystis poenicansa]WAS96726.1 hypothetical protein O0S08_11300 [Nannocystis poenicansa]
MASLLAPPIAELPAHPKRRCYRRLLESVALALLAASTSLAAGCGGSGGQHRGVVAHEVAEVAKLAEQFRASQGRCPRDFREMVAHGMANRVRADPWQNHYMIDCTEDRLQVCSRAWDFDSPEDDICAELRTLRPPPQKPGERRGE